MVDSYKNNYYDDKELLMVLMVTSIARAWPKS